jgi:hypothetical protein
MWGKYVQGLGAPTQHPPVTDPPDTVSDRFFFFYEIFDRQIGCQLTLLELAIDTTNPHRFK